MRYLDPSRYYPQGVGHGTLPLPYRVVQLAEKPQLLSRCIDRDGACTVPDIHQQDVRSILPLGTYTTFWFKADLRNLLHFINLRASLAAQPEMQDYANAIYDIVKHEFPQTIHAFEEYCLNTEIITTRAQTIIQKIWKMEPNQEEEELVTRQVNETYPDLDEFAKAALVHEVIGFLL